jgi:putative flippase GtrA
MKSQILDIEDFDNSEDSELISSTFVSFKASLIKQVFSSLSSTVVDFIISIFLNRILGVYYVYANIIGGVCGATTNFFLGRKWVYKKKEDKMQYQMFRFFLLHLTTVSINSTLVYFVKENTGLPFEVSKMIVATLFGFFFNFLMGRYFVFHSWGKK